MLKRLALLAPLILTLLISSGQLGFAAPAASVILATPAISGSPVTSAASDGPNPIAQELANQECDFWMDPQGVPHVRGRTDRVALACVGFLHGRDRTWQMDYLRLTAQGRSSEVVGRKSLRTDVFIRLLDLRTRARKLFDALNSETQKDLWAYSYGVNQGFPIGYARSYEYRELGGRPELWTPWDSLSVLLLQSFDQTGRGFEQDLREAARLKKYPAEAVSSFSEIGMPWETSVLMKGEGPSPKTPSASSGVSAKEASIKSASYTPLPADSLRELAALLDIDPERRFSERIPNLGSNNWVIAPSRSEGGKAWLANDPHVKLTHPSFWYWVHIQGHELDAMGATIPGMPLVVSGANRKVAWGLTNSYFDAADVIAIPEKELKTIRTERPWIWFKLIGIRLPYFFQKLEWLENGWPILPIDAPEGYRLVLRWTGFALKPEDVSHLFDVMHAKTIGEMDHTLSKVGLPSWNYVFADTHGGIGFRTMGDVPARKESSSPSIPLIGVEKLSLKEALHWPLLPAEEMPAVMNPKRGWVATANNRQWAPGTGHPDGGTAYAESFRAFRIHELILSNPRQNRESIQSAQCDVQAVDARFFLPEIVKRLDEAAKLAAIESSTESSTAEATAFSTLEKSALETLRNWNLQATLDCRACGVYRTMMNDLLADYDGNEAALYRAFQGHPLPGVPVSEQTVFTAFQAALERLGATKTGILPEWGTIHQAPFRHLSGLETFETQALPTPGDDQSVNNGNSHWRNGRFEQTSGASQRLIVEMTDPPTIYAVLPGMNIDVERPNLLREGGPWRRWAECFIERKYFPVDWDQTQSTRLKLLTVGNPKVPAR